jgi:peptide/nickel transport system substrate-binding protein
MVRRVLPVFAFFLLFLGMACRPAAPGSTPTPALQPTPPPATPAPTPTPTPRPLVVAPTPTPVGFVPTPTPTPPPEARPRRGGILNWMNYADPARLDVHGESPLAVQQATAGVFSGLLHHDPLDPFRIAPDLAERWEVSPDGTVYTFFLRRGVQWHDGRPLTAADVKMSLDRVTGKLDPAFRSPRCGGLITPMVRETSIVDDLTVRVTLHFPTPVFLPSLASAWCRILPKHILERDGNFLEPKSQVGTGPFRFKRYERGIVIEWERNGNYYDRELPYLDGVRQYIIVGVPTQIAAIKTGRVHLAPSTWPGFTKSQALEIQRTRGDTVEAWQWSLNTIRVAQVNARRPPFDNKDLRRAVFLAVDRHAFIEKLWEGSGTPCAILPPNLYGEYALPLEEVLRTPGCRRPKDADIAEAKRLVAKHYPAGLEIEAAVRQVGDYVDGAQLVVQDLAAIGIRASLRVFESAAGFAYYGRGEHTFIAVQDTAMVVAEPYTILAVQFAVGGGQNFSGWRDEKVERWIVETLRELDPKRRVALFHEVQRYLLTEDSPHAVIGWAEQWFVRDRRLQGYKPAPTLYDNLTFMRVWLAE